MTLQSSGPLKASEIQTEFGGASPFSLSDYYAGGANVPAGTEGINGPIPASGTIKFSEFYGSHNFVPEVKTLVTGTLGTLDGFVSGSVGSLSPDELMRGVQITGIWTDTNTSELLVSVTGLLEQYFFNSIEISGQGTFLTADATSFGGSPNSVWHWATGFQFSGSRTITFR